MIKHTTFNFSIRMFIWFFVHILFVRCTRRCFYCYSKIFYGYELILFFMVNLVFFLFCFFWFIRCVSKVVKCSFWLFFQMNVSFIKSFYVGPLTFNHYQSIVVFLLSTLIDTGVQYLLLNVVRTVYNHLKCSPVQIDRYGIWFLVDGVWVWYFFLLLHQMNCTEIDIRCFSRCLRPTGFSYTVITDITVSVIMIFDMPMFMCVFCVWCYFKSQSRLLSSLKMLHTLN